MKNPSTPSSKPSSSTSSKPSPKHDRPRRRLPRVVSRLIFWLALFSVLAGSFFIVFTPVLGGPFIEIPSFSISLNRIDTRVSSEAILEEVSQLSQLETEEYIYKLVFPHDFFPDGISIDKVYSKIAQATLENSESRGDISFSDILSDEETLFLQAYNLARSTGMQPLSGSYDFIVLTLVVEFGYDFETSPPLVEITEEDQLARIQIPQAEILRIRVEDPDSTSYTYPDVGIDPQNWSRISHFAVDYISGLDELETLRLEAGEGLREFFQTFLSGGVNIETQFVTMEKSE